MTFSIADFLEIRTAVGLGFSPDGTTALVNSNLTGTMQLYLVPASGGPPRAITDEAEPVGGAFLPSDGRIVLTMDAGGNERHQLFLLDPRSSERVTLVEEPDFLHQYGGASRDGTTICYASNARNGTDFDVYVLDIASGASRRIFEMGGWCSAAGFSPDGRTVAVLRLTERNADNDCYLVDLLTGEVDHVTPHEGEASFSGPAWVADSSGFFLSTDLDADFRYVARFDRRTATMTPALTAGGDLACRIDRAGRSLFVTENAAGYSRHRVLDVGSGSVRELSLPEPGVAGVIPSDDGARGLFTVSSARVAGDVWTTDLATGETSRLTTSPGTVPEDVFVEPSSEWFTSFDRERIPAFVYRPRRTEGEAPVVCFMHGGPESQYRPAFSPVIQYLVYRGYAVVAPNVRGSTGYGKRFHHLDDVDRRLDSVADMAAMHDWLARVEGIDHRRAALWGGSYGGYMVLAGLAFQPERWAAGVDIVGISNLVTFLENTSSWRRRFREREYGFLDRDRALLERASPLNRVDAIRAPLFIIHGANDPRVPLSEAEQIHERLRARDVPCELLVYRDEGHGLAKLSNRLDAYPRAVDFLDGVLHP